MSHDVCPTCGRPRHDLVFEPNEAVRDESPASRLGAYVALLVIPLLIAAVAVVSRDDDPVAEPDDPVSPLPGTSDTVDPDDSPAPDLTQDPDGFRLVFANAGGTVVIDLESGASAVADIELLSPELAYDDPFVLVADDRRTLAVHPSFPDDAFALATNHRLVPTDAIGEYVFRPVDDDTEVFIGQSADGSFGRRLSIPLGTRQLAVPGLGLLLVAADGATFRAEFAGFEPYSDAPVIAATPTHRLELQCAQPLECATVLVESVSGTEVVVPAEVSATWDQPVLSPDGRSVASAGPDGVVRHSVADWSSTLLVDTDVGGGPAWAPDSSFVAVVDDSSSALTVHLFFTDGAPSESISVAGSTAIGPVESNVLVVP